MRRLTISLLSLAILVFLVSGVVAHDGFKNISGYAAAGSGSSGPFASHNVALLSHLELNQMGAGSSVFGNDIWGWTDNTSGRKFALMGMTNQTSFVEVTDARAPVYLGALATHEFGRNDPWRDVKVYQDHAYIVADSSGGTNDQGVQVFDLKQLLTASQTAPTAFTETNHYAGMNSAHNIVINEDSGFAYVVGTQADAQGSAGGLHALRLDGAGNIAFAGSFSGDGYTHDAQAVIYNGPDQDYAGQEVVFASNTDSFTIISAATNAQNNKDMTLISRNTYTDTGYAHQGWLSEDQRYFFMDDELDERNNITTGNTRTLIWNVEDLDAPVFEGFFEGTNRTIDHNLYTKNGLIFQANYTAGLRILEMNEVGGMMQLEEVAFFDTYMTNDGVSFNGAWSVYPYFDDGTIIISDINGGLFVVQMVPEPTSLGLLGLGFIGLAFRRKRSAA